MLAIRRGLFILFSLARKTGFIDSESFRRDSKTSQLSLGQWTSMNIDEYGGNR